MGRQNRVREGFMYGKKGNCVLMGVTGSYDYIKIINNKLDSFV